MNILTAKEQALKSDNITFLEVMKNECNRKARTSRNNGFSRWWTELSQRFESRIVEVQEGGRNGSK